MHSCFFILLLTHVSDFGEKIFNNIIAMSTEELQDMESRVIEAAKRVFVRKGYEATKMGDIALEVGISRTAMHYYFRTKEMLFDAIFGQLMDALLPNIGVIVGEPTSFLDIRYKLDILNSIRKLARERNIAVIMSLHELDLVQKVSDMVACVDGTTVSHIGPPEEIFQGSLVQKLYGIEEKNFDSMLGIMQMPGNKAAPNVFVIGGGGAAIPTYYRLQREHIPFAAGILFENDVEYPVATALASKVITAKAFYPMEEAQLEEAKKILAGCETCICTCENFGPYNMLNKELRRFAEEQGKLK